MRIPSYLILLRCARYVLKSGHSGQGWQILLVLAWYGQKSGLTWKFLWPTRYPYWLRSVDTGPLKKFIDISTRGHETQFRADLKELVPLSEAVSLNNVMNNTELKENDIRKKIFEWIGSQWFGMSKVNSDSSYDGSGPFFFHSLYHSLYHSIYISLYIPLDILSAYPLLHPLPLPLGILT